jgi:NADP-dependent alcohol dehydrogenase
VTTATGHRLVTGDDLRPQLAVLDHDQLASLPPAKVGEGALEILLRVAGTAASGALAPSAFEAAVDLGRRILAAGDRAQREDTVRARGSLALLSAESRWSWSAHPTDPFASRHWYAANELASTASIGKIAATLVVLPRLWRLVLLGERRLGDAESLDRFWRRLRPGRSAPHEDVLAIAASWRLPPPPVPAADVLRRAVDATIATWARPNRALAQWDAALASAVLGLEERTAPHGLGPHPDSGTEITAPARITPVGGR